MPYKAWHEMLKHEPYAPSSKAIRNYLTLTKGLESPTPYHIWSFISLFAALAGGRIYVNRGALGKMKLNMGIVLMGFPAIRKSSAISTMEAFAQGLPLQYGPTDTGGQRQGIMAAMLPRWQYDSMGEKDELDINPITLEILAGFDSTGILPALQNKRVPPAAELYFTSRELGQLLAAPSRELLDFFTNTLDGVSIHYQLKTQSIRIKNPLLNLLGATTPGSLYDILPRGAPGHGFLSRLVFVYADRVATSTPIPLAWDSTQTSTKEQMLSAIDETFDRVDGGLTLSPAAEKTYSEIYRYEPAINDIRLQAYKTRRSEHLLKVAGIVCLMRGALNQMIVASDVRLAHAILVMTEGLMPRSFNGLDQRPIGKVLLSATEYLESTRAGERLDEAPIDKVVQQLLHLGSTKEITDQLEALAAQERLHSDNAYVRLDTKAKKLGEIMFRSQYVGAVQADEFVPLYQD